MPASDNPCKISKALLPGVDAEWPGPSLPVLPLTMTNVCYSAPTWVLTNNFNK